MVLLVTLHTPDSQSKARFTAVLEEVFDAGSVFVGGLDETWYSTMYCHPSAVNQSFPRPQYCIPVLYASCSPVFYPTAGTVRQWGTLLPI